MPHHISSRFGESRLRMLRVVRRGDRHDPKELSITLRFDGAQVLPGEPLKNLVYRVAAERGHDEVEALGLALGARLVQQYPQIGLARIEIAEEGWRRLEVGGKPQGQAFTPSGGERRTAVITTNGDRTSLSAGIDNLLLLRSAGLAGPAGAEDAREDGAPLLIAALSARWSYTSGEIAFGPYRQGVRMAIIETFSWHAKGSVHETLAGMAEVILASYEEISAVTLAFQERPYRPVDLLELSVESDALFLVHDEPLGVVEVTVERR